MSACSRCHMFNRDRNDHNYCKVCRAQYARERRFKRYLDPALRLEDRKRGLENVARYRAKKRSDERLVEAVKHFEASDGGFSCPVRKCRLCAQELYTGKKL